MLNQLTAFGVISFLNFLSTVILGSFAFLKGRKSDVKVAYAIFAYTLALYAFFYFLWQSSNDMAWATALFKWTIVGVVLINTSFFNFTYTLLNMHKDHKWHLYLVHSINLFFCYGALGLFYHDWKVKFTYGLWPVPSVVFHIYLIWWFVQVIWCFYLIWKKGIVETTGKQKQQCKWVLVSCFIGYVGGATNWFVWYGINFPPYMNGGVALYALILGYAVLRHQLLDIEVFIRKTVIFAGIFAMAMVVVSVVSTILRGYLGQYISISTDISTLVSVLIAFLFYKPTRDFLVTVTDKFLFQRKEGIKDILNRLSERIITIVDIEQIGKTILSTLEETLRLESGMIFLKNKKLGNYRMLEHFGMTGDELTGSIKVLIDDPEIMRHFSDKGMAILNLDHPDKRIGLPPAVSSWLKISKSRVCIPLLINEDQFGLMVLGEKKSDQEFTQEEMDFFPTIASQSALAIRNASLFETVLEERESKLKAQDEAKRAHYAQTVAHEIKNKLVSINMPGHSLATHYVPNLKDIFERFYKDKAPQAVDKKYLQICDKLEHMGKELQSTASEIFVTAKTAQYDLEEDREVLVTISVNLIWQSAIHESGVKDIHFDIEMPDDFKADANPTLFKAVLVNLLTNARDALTEQTDKRIEFKCRYDQIESQRVAYFELRDNGPGIPREIQEKIFLKGFSTKKKPVQMDYRSSGSGYGLYVCKETIENWHHGKIWIESEPGKGTAFKFWLPFKEDNLQEKEPK